MVFLYFCGWIAKGNAIHRILSLQQFNNSTINNSTTTIQQSTLKHIYYGHHQHLRCTDRQ